MSATTQMLLWRDPTPSLSVTSQNGLKHPPLNELMCNTFSKLIIEKMPWWEAGPQLKCLSCLNLVLEEWHRDKTNAIPHGQLARVLRVGGITSNRTADIMVTIYKFPTYALNLCEGTKARRGGQVARRWSCKPKLIGLILFHAFKKNTLDKQITVIISLLDVTWYSKPTTCRPSLPGKFHRLHVDGSDPTLHSRYNWTRQRAQGVDMAPITPWFQSNQ